MHKFFFIISLLYSSTCFEHYCAHHQEVIIVLYSIWYRHTCKWPSGAHVVHLTEYNFDLLMMSTIVFEACRGI